MSSINLEMNSLEDDDDTFYYEVEKIIQMHVQDNGVRMFEIKWKNYDSSNNTWEPEHNLNCPSILKAFLEENKLGKKKKTKKRDRDTSKTIPAVATATTTKPSTTSTTKPSTTTSTTKPSTSTTTKPSHDYFKADEVHILDADTDEAPKKKVKKDKGKGKETEAKQKSSQFRLAISGDKPTNTSLKLNKDQESRFTTIKRNVNQNTKSSDVDINQLLKSLNTTQKKPQPQYTSSYQPPTSLPNAPRPIPPYSNHHTNITTTPTQSPHSSPVISSLPPPPSTPTPSPPHPSQHVGNRPSTVVVDPRFRPHLPGNNIKRTNSKDPRIRLENIKKMKNANATAIATPFAMETTLYNGSKFISTIKVEGQQTCYHETQIKALIQAASNNTNEIRIAHTLPLKALNSVLKDRPVSFMSISAKDKTVDLSKLKSYYQVNEMAGIVHHPSLSQALVLLAEGDIKKLTNLNRETIDIASYTQLCGLFIDDLIPKPPCLAKEINYELDTTDLSTPFVWNRVTSYLKFPEQLSKLSNKAKFLVYGHSDTSQLLIKANNQLKTIQKPTASYVMMFDRYNETLFSRNLTKHKKELSTQIWEFGVPNFSESKMIPARQVFPNNSGGYVTTDMKNILHNPSIIQTIVENISLFNDIPSLYGEWKFILPHNWIQQLRKLIKEAASGQRAKEAIIAITIALSSDSVQILKIWCAETDEIDELKFIDKVAHEYYTTRQYFVYIDDIDSIPSKDHMNSIDFVQSNKLFGTFA